MEVDQGNTGVFSVRGAEFRASQGVFAGKEVPAFGRLCVERCCVSVGTW